MLLKIGVTFEKAKPPAWYAMGFVDALSKLFTGDQATMTSITDGKHGQGSKHYDGVAIDIRTRDLRKEQIDSLYMLLREHLDPYGFDTVLENDHIHVEFDPKGHEKFFRFTP